MTTPMATAMAGWRRIHDPDAHCDGCGTGADRRTIYAQPIRGRPEEGDYYICFICLLVARQEGFV